MKRSVTAVLTVALMLMPAVALGTPPEVVFEAEEAFEDTIPAGAICEFEIEIRETANIRVTEYYHGDGSLKKVTVHVRGTTLITGPGGMATDRWTINEVFDPESSTVTQTGNIFNVHSGAGGILINDSGRIVIDAQTGEALVINGPHQAWEGDFEAACAALSD